MVSIPWIMPVLSYVPGTADYMFLAISFYCFWWLDSS